MAFSLRKFTAEAGKPVTGQCESGEQIVAVLCSTTGTVADDNAKATCAPAPDGQSNAQLALTCVK